MQEIRQSENNEKFTELPNSWEERGIRKGMEKGMEKGIVHGKERGAEEAKKEIVLEMLKEGASIEFIAKVTHLDVETIEQLKKDS